MKLFVFGNEDHKIDDLAFEVVNNLNPIPGVEVVFVSANDDLPIDHTKSVYILDTVVGIDDVTLIDESRLDQIVLSPRNSAHDYDLNFQLKYLVKLGKITKINIIGLPTNRNINYDLIHSILRKFVAQDIQGS